MTSCDVEFNLVGAKCSHYSMENVMRHSVHASLLAGLLSTVVFADDMKKNDREFLPPGTTAKVLNDQQDVRSVLASATSAAITKSGFDDLVERLTTQDRNRIGEFSEKEFSDLDGRIEQITKAWETKYGTTFNLDRDVLFDGLVIIHEGEVTDASVAKSHWPVPAQGQSTVPARVNDGSPARSDVPSTNADYLSNGQNVAVVQLQPGHMLAGASLSMVHELVDDWRIDVPDNISGPELYNSVKNALTQIGDGSVSWPADETEAYRMIGHRLLLALYNVPDTKGNKDNQKQ